MHSSLALLRALGWDGVAMVEYKLSPEGKAILMEVNGRYWGTLSLPISAGMDFPWYQWQLVHGERPDIPDNYAAGTRWRFTVGYFYRLCGLLAKARLAEARKTLRRDVHDLPADFSPSVPDATWTPSDPMPSIVEALRGIQYFASHAVARATEPLAISSKFQARPNGPQDNPAENVGN